MTSTELARLGERLRVTRTASGMTQDQAAESLGMSRTTLAAIEKGDRDMRAEELVALAKLYEVSVHSLLRPYAVKDLEDTRLLLFAAEASELGIYSEGQLADMLALDRVELRRAIDAFFSMESIDARG